MQYKKTEHMETAVSKKRPRTMKTSTVLASWGWVGPSSSECSNLERWLPMSPKSVNPIRLPECLDPLVCAFHQEIRRHAFPSLDSGQV